MKREHDFYYFKLNEIDSEYAFKSSTKAANRVKEKKKRTTKIPKTAKKI